MKAAWPFIWTVASTSAWRGSASKKIDGLIVWAFGFLVLSLLGSEVFSSFAVAPSPSLWTPSLASVTVFLCFQVRPFERTLENSSALVISFVVALHNCCSKLYRKFEFKHALIARKMASKLYNTYCWFVYFWTPLLWYWKSARGLETRCLRPSRSTSPHHLQYCPEEDWMPAHFVSCQRAIFSFEQLATQLPRCRLPAQSRGSFVRVNSQTYHRHFHHWTRSDPNKVSPVLGL